jgi:hypothetical protein
MFRDKKTGKMRPSGYEPGISIESLDVAKAIYRPIKYKFHDKDAEGEEEDKKFSSVHILDLKTLTSVLTGEVCSFPTACDIFGVKHDKAAYFAKADRSAVNAPVPAISPFALATGSVHRPRAASKSRPVETGEARSPQKILRQRQARTSLKRDHPA